MKIKKDDMVKVISGKDRDKIGKVLWVLKDKNRAIVEGISLAKKHLRPSAKQQKGGIVDKETSVNCSNLQVFCARCSRSTRVGKIFLADGSRERYCKKCGEPLKV